MHLEMNLACSTCEGSGIVKEQVNVEGLLDMVKGYHSDRLKIDAIKAVRNRDWLETAPEKGGTIRLKAAKEIVEAAFQLFDNLESIDSVKDIC